MVIQQGASPADRIRLTGHPRIFWLLGGQAASAIFLVFGFRIAFARLSADSAAMSGPVPKDSMPPPVTFSELFRTFLKIGLLSFGGPAGQIATMHRILVDEQGWLEEQEFLTALSFCMLLPGPEAMQLATYSGWRLRGVGGGLLAGLLFVIPGAIVILALAMLYTTYGAVDWVGAVFLGVKSAVVVIVIEALLKVANRALKRRDHRCIAALAFVAIFFLDAPFPLLVGLAALYGFFTGSAPDPSPVPGAKISTARSLRTVAIWLAVWWAPLAALAVTMPGSILIPVGLFFAKLAVVTFGGAYAVLAYMAQQVVGVYHWLDAGQMIDGLGLAETTPGPLILVTEFVGYLAGFRQGGIGLGIAAAVLTLWMTFSPCFLWIFAGAPYVSRLSGQPRLRNALAAVTATVVGVILNLTLWFALHVLFGEVARMQAGWLVLWRPDIATWNPVAFALTGLAALLLLRLHMGLGRVLAISAVAGWLVSAIT